MHRSRIGVVLIDHPVESFDRAATFWGEAVGAMPVPDADADQYASIGTMDSLKLELQRLGAGSPPRVHLDIETDDVQAEIARLERLDATVLEQREGYAILTDPGGLVFCVVPVQTGDDFERLATRWT